jgi:hypothetical protein
MEGVERGLDLVRYLSLDMTYRLMIRNEYNYIFLLQLSSPPFGG